MSTTHHISTAQELLAATDLGRCELVRGELVMMSPAGFEHGRIAARIHLHLGKFVVAHALGEVLSAETGYQIARDPDTVRAPDVAFVRADRVPATPTQGYFEGAPDLAVEVLSPNDRAGEVLDKVQDWLDAGCRAVWIVDPIKRTLAIYRPGHPMVRLSVGDTLTAEDILPGFNLPVAEVFG